LAELLFEGPMKKRFLFEFLDLAWLPDSLLLTLRDVLELCLEDRFLGYYRSVVNELLEIVNAEGQTNLMELGAGTAPLSRRLAQRLLSRRSSPLVVEVSDLYPDRDVYRGLEQEFPGVIKPFYEAVDFSSTLPVKNGSLLVFSASFHHIPFERRIAVLQSLAQHRVVVFEPLRPNLWAVVLCMLDFFPGLLTPLFFLTKRTSGHGRRFLWCWALPIAGLMIGWDGIVSLLRVWSPAEWHRHFETATGGRNKTLKVSNWRLGQRVEWSPVQSEQTPTK
jgi:hypothetical protein